MVRIKVRTILDLKRIVGKGEVEISLSKGSSVREVLAEMANTYGEELASYLFNTNGSDIIPRIRIMVNGHDIAFLNRLETELHDGDEILILPPVAGG